MALLLRDLSCLLQQVEEDLLEQLLHPGAGAFLDFLFDCIERKVDSIDLLLDLLADGSEVE